MVKGKSAHIVLDDETREELKSLRIKPAQAVKLYLAERKTVKQDLNQFKTELSRAQSTIATLELRSTQGNERLNALAKAISGIEDLKRAITILQHSPQVKIDDIERIETLLDSVKTKADNTDRDFRKLDDQLTKELVPFIVKTVKEEVARPRQ